MQRRRAAVYGLNRDPFSRFIADVDELPMPLDTVYGFSAIMSMGISKMSAIFSHY